MSNTSGKKKALFAEGNVPPGGVCLSSFVVISNGPKILVGKMVKPEAWVERFFVGPKFAEVYSKSGKYMIPARHLAWYESPLEAAESVIKDQVQLKVPSSRISFLDLQSHVSGDVGDKEQPPHWDFCFVYGVDLKADEAKKVKSPEWFGDLGFRPRSELKPEHFTRGHGDVLEKAGVIRPGKKTGK
ncbi:MAG TPA: hypothetical protein VLY21_05170 [Nitrososphaerales archaeon]|nr:hypothetical protein [Nitrososphaerales archaeon]